MIAAGDWHLGDVQSVFVVGSIMMGAAVFAINALIKTQIAKLNGRYVQSPVFELKHKALDQKLDSMQAYQVEHFHELKNQMAIFGKALNDTDCTERVNTGRISVLEERTRKA